MKISFKILILAILFSLLFILNINAANISMDLEDYNQTITTNETNNTIDNNVLANESGNEVDNNTLNQETDITDDEDISPRTTSTTTSNDDEFLTMENVLSIIIIVIGILLVFLAIAILVRFK